MVSAVQDIDFTVYNLYILYTASAFKPTCSSCLTILGSSHRLYEQNLVQTVNYSYIWNVLPFFLSCSLSSRSLLLPCWLQEEFARKEPSRTNEVRLASKDAVTPHSFSLRCFLSRQAAKAQPTAWLSLSPWGRERQLKHFTVKVKYTLNVVRPSEKRMRLAHMLLGSERSYILQ